MPMILFIICNAIVLTAIIWLAFRFVYLITDKRKNNFFAWIFRKTRWLNLILAGLLFSAIISLIVYRFFPAKLDIPFYAEVTKHFDFTGILIGILGILIGVIIVMYVERSHATKEEKLNETIRSLQESTALLGSKTEEVTKATVAIDTATKRILSNITALNIITSHSERFSEISNVIRHANETPDNKLYILGYGASYGQLIIHNLQIILSCSGDHGRKKIIATDLKTMSYNRIYDDYIEPLIKKQEDMTHLLIEAIEQHGKEIHFGILRNEHMDKDHIDKHRQFLSERIMRRKKIEFFDHLDGSLFGIPVTCPEDYFLLWNRNPVAGATMSDAAKEADFINEIVKKNKSFERELMAKDGGRGLLNFICFDYIPFQFFLSVPNNPDDTSSYKAIVIFTNYYNVGSKNSIVGFSSENSEMCDGLEKMFKLLKNNEENKPDRSLNSLFKGTSNINMVLKNNSLMDAEGVTQEHINDIIGFVDVTPVPDIEAKENLMTLFREYDIRFNSIAKYIKKESEDLQKISDHLKSKNNFESYLSVGLFLNSATEALLTESRNMGIDFIELITRKSRLEKNKINIAVGNEAGRILYEPFDESLVIDDPDSFDIGIFARLRYNGKWNYVCGGINFLGTRRIAECLRTCADDIAGFVNDLPYVAVFRIPNNTTVVELSFITKFDNGKYICRRSFTPG